MKLIEWLKTHKPLDFRYIIIICLLLKIFYRDLIWFTMLLVGFTSYPSKIDYIPIFEKAGNKIASAYTSAMTKLYEAGFNLGESL